MRFTKHVILAVFLLLLCGELFSQQYWIKLNSPTIKNLNCLSFVDSLNGWAVGDSGIIIHTSNGGLNWVFQNSNINNQIFYVFFLNKRLGWGLAWSFSDPFYGTKLLKTTNGGTNWGSDNYPMDSTYILKIQFLDSLNGYICGSSNVFLKTTNAGINWIQCPSPGFSPRSFAFYSNNFGYACGGIMDYSGYIGRTVNRAESWITTTVASEPVYKIEFIDSLFAVGIGGDFENGTFVVKTYNAGNYWNYKECGIFGIPQSFSIRKRNEWWVALNGCPGLIRTIDTGNTWIQVNTPDSTEIYNLTFTDERHGFAAGYHGAILKFNYSAVNINNQNSLIPDNIILCQNYPNPFNPSTIIKFEIAENGKSKTENGIVTLKIYNLLGQEILTLVNEKLSPGIYEIPFSINQFPNYQLPSGVYFYRLTAGDFIQTMKMILLK